MPLLYTGETSDPIKVACRSCIDGHRSPICVHLDRILVQVRQPGRPRVHCTHGNPSWGATRCQVCYPVIAYVIPDGHERMKKCGCRDRGNPLKGWKQTSPEEARRHEEQRNKDLAEKRLARQQSKDLSNKSKAAAAARAPISQQITQPSSSRSGGCCSSARTAPPPNVSQLDSAPQLDLSSTSTMSPQSLPTPQAPQITLPEDFSCGFPPSSYLVDEEGSCDKKPVTPYPHRPMNPPTAGECDCGDEPGQCHCVGCARHPHTEETHGYVNEMIAAYEKQQAEEETKENQSTNPDVEEQNDPGTNEAYMPRTVDFSMYHGNNGHDATDPGEGPSGGFRAYTMGAVACLNCDCGPECRCANCPCHPQALDAPTPMDMQQAHSESVTPDRRTLLNSQYDNPNRPDESTLDLFSFPHSAGNFAMNGMGHPPLFGDLAADQGAVSQMPTTGANYDVMQTQSHLPPPLEPPFDLQMEMEMQDQPFTMPWALTNGYHAPRPHPLDVQRDAYQPSPTRTEFMRTMSHDSVFGTPPTD